MSWSYPVKNQADSTPDTGVDNAKPSSQNQFFMFQEEKGLLYGWKGARKRRESRKGKGQLT